MTTETDGAPDNVPGLKAKVRELLSETKRQQARIRELEGRKRPEEMSAKERFLADAERRLQGLDDAARTAELEKLKAEMAPLIEVEIAEHGKQLAERAERMRNTITRLMRENAANELILRIRRPGIEARVLLPLVLDRFDVKEEAGEFSVVVRGPNGEAITADALAEELRANPALAPLVAGASQAEKDAHAAKVRATLGLRPNGTAR